MLRLGFGGCFREGKLAEEQNDNQKKIDPHLKIENGLQENLGSIHLAAVGRDAGDGHELSKVIAIFLFFGSG